MTTHVFMDNFRGFSNVCIPLSQVNFLVGENSTGKTSFLELLEILSNPTYWGFEPSFGLLGGIQKHFTDLVSASSINKSSFSIGAAAFDEENGVSDFGMIVSYVQNDGRPVPDRVSVLSGNAIRTVSGQLWRNKRVENSGIRSKKRSARVSNGSRSDRAKHFMKVHKFVSGFRSWKTPQNRIGAPLLVRFGPILYAEHKIHEQNIFVPFKFEGKIVELAPIRTKPRRTYDAPQTSFSAEGEHVPYVIKKRLLNKAQAESFRAFLKDSGRSSGLFESVRIKPYGKDAMSPFEVQVTLGKTVFGIGNVGYGVSQSLPILVEMFTRKERTGFAIQQPEVHLHPRAQATFGDVIAEIARSDGKTFVVETHSDFTIDRFRLNVRKNGYVSSQVLFFERSAQGNHVWVISIKDDGILDSDQPDSYREFFYNESLGMLA